MMIHFGRTYSSLLLFGVCGKILAAEKHNIHLSLDLHVSTPTVDYSGKYEKITTSTGSCGCTDGWTSVEGFCLFSDVSISLPWNEGRKYCQEKHVNADLATFKDANEFAGALAYVRSLNTTANIWIGGSDLDEDNKWDWITEESMPMESPFWGSWNGKKQPAPKNVEHCAFLFQPDRYYIHDYKCQYKAEPLCQYRLPQN